MLYVPAKDLACRPIHGVDSSKTMIVRRRASVVAAATIEHRIVGQLVKVLCRWLRMPWCSMVRCGTVRWDVSTDDRLLNDDVVGPTTTCAVSLEEE
jgi:hypothetical protein